MDFNLFIIPATLIVVQLMKQSDKIGTRKGLLPLLAVGFGAVAGAGFGLYYGGDIFQHVFMGAVFGASASGIYDAAKAPQYL